MRIKRGDSKEVDRQKKVRFFWWLEGACRIDSCCVFLRACRIGRCCVFFRYANSYMMASSVFCLEPGLIKG